MVQEFGKELKEIPIMENGKMEMLMDMVYIFGWMEIDMKDSLVKILKMDKEKNYLLMEMYLLVHMFKENLKIMENTFGKMEIHFKVKIKLYYIYE